MECVESRNYTRLRISIRNLLSEVNPLRRSAGTRIRLGKSRGKAKGCSNQCQALGEHVVVQVGLLVNVNRGEVNQVGIRTTSCAKAPP